MRRNPLLLTALLLLCCLPEYGWAQSRKLLTQKAEIEAAIPQDMIRGHMEFLASDALRGRDVNTPGGMAAAEYIRSQMRRLGVKQMPGAEDYFQPVRLQQSSLPTSGTLSVEGETLKHGEDFILMDGGNIDLSAPFAFVGHGTPSELEEIGNKKLQGKILIALCGDGEDNNPQSWLALSKDKKQEAQEMGALALFEIYGNSQLPWPLLRRLIMESGDAMSLADTTASASVPHFWGNTSDAALMEILKKGGRKMELEISGEKTTVFESPNVVGFLPGTDEKLKDEYVIYSAHYDHVGVGKADAEGDTIYNGARDNATGVSGVLSAMEYLAEHPSRRSSLFILFTAEEKGLLGSKWFTEHPTLPLEQVVFCFNIDNAGYSDTTITTVFGLHRTTAGPHFSKACETFGLTAIDDPAPEQNLFDRSDNVNFAKKGIPAPTYSMGFRAFDASIFKYYHQASDETDSMDFDYLEKYIHAFILMGQRIGNDDKRPFWTEGDKYYPAGLELYGGNPLEE